MKTKTALVALLSLLYASCTLAPKIQAENVRELFIEPSGNNPVYIFEFEHHQYIYTRRGTVLEIPPSPPK